MFHKLEYIVLGYAALLVIVYFIQERFIFKPEKLPAGFQYKYDIPFKELFFDVSPGVRINGLHFYRADPVGLILYLHGNSRSIKGWAKYARDFYRYNYDVVMVDYRGFGKSTGRRSERDMLNDIQFVYDSLLRQFIAGRQAQPQPSPQPHQSPQLTTLNAGQHILVYGRSIGSGFAAKLAADNDPRYLILDSPYYNFRKVVGRFLPILPVRYVLRYHLRTDLWLPRVRCHTYIIHGTRDWLIPIRQSERLQKLNPSRITLIRIEGGRHNNLTTFPEYHNFLRDILRE
jgi:pimeloyl-ACP methyl ester carboxylesterase